MPARSGARRTARLRLEPIGPQHAEDLWRLHQDEGRAGVHDGAPFSLDVRAGMRRSVCSTSTARTSPEER